MPFRKQLQLFDDHRDMLGDDARMSAYADAIGRVVRAGDRVVDLGSGVGILGFMALRAGAAHVYAVEQTDSIELARTVAAHNGLSDRMTFFHGNSRDFELDKPVDVLLSETLGSFGIEENTLAFTLDARRRLLAPRGRMIPNGLRLWTAPVTNPVGREHVEFWRDVAGFDFAPAVDEMLGRMSLADVDVDDLLSQPQPYASLDLLSLEDESLANKQVFPILRDGTLDGVAGWFEARLDDEVYLANGPGLPRTHWRQAFFPVREPIEVVAGDFFELTLAIGPDPAKGPRSDDTRLQIEYRCTQVGSG